MSEIQSEINILKSILVSSGGDEVKRTLDIFVLDELGLLETSKIKYYSHMRSVHYERLG